MKRMMWLLPLLAGVSWGSVGIFVRILTAAGMDNPTVLSSRMMGAALLLFVGMLVHDRSLLRMRPRDGGVFVAAGLLGMLGLNFCYNEAINRLTLSLAAVLLSLAPVFVLLWAAVLFRERITPRKIASASLAVLGCSLVGGLMEGGSARWTPAGIFVGLAAAFFYALYSVFSRTAMEKGYHVFTVTFYSTLTMALALLPFTDWGVIGAFAAAAPAGNTLFLALHSLFASVLPYVLYTLSLQYVETGKAAILAAGGEPSAAMLFGLLFFVEVPSVLSLAGLVLTVIALSFLCAPGREEGAPRPA
jgi:drug/metabolite transporter (DMT)-like permease